MNRELLLMRDIVDNQLLDVNGERVTKVAGVEAELREGRRPVVKGLLVGTGPLVHRISPRIGELIQRITGGRREVCIPWGWVREVGPDVKLGVTSADTGATGAEDWVREKIIKHIPGSG